MVNRYKKQKSWWVYKNEAVWLVKVASTIDSRVTLYYLCLN